MENRSHWNRSHDRRRTKGRSIGWAGLLLVSVMLPVTPLMAHETGSVSEGAMSEGAMEEHQHEILEIPANQTAPTVNLVLHPDPVRGWNLEVQTTNFRFAPEEIETAASKATSPAGEVIPGHAHLYIDGKKVTRLYGNWYYIGELPPGQHEIRVSLSTNQHEELMHNGESIAATLEVEIPTEPTAGSHSH